MKRTPKLPLTADERALIRKATLKLTRLSDVTPDELAQRTGMALQRCEYLIALSQFQSLESVGAAVAEDLWKLGFRSNADLKDANPSEMYERLQQMNGKTIDPCVEDIFRCAIAQVSFPDLPAPLRQWWMWVDHRGKPTVTCDHARECDA